MKNLFALIIIIICFNTKLSAQIIYYDTVTINNIETIYDTITTHETIHIVEFDTVNVTINDTVTLTNTITIYDTMNIINNVTIYDTINVINTTIVYDTTAIVNYISVSDTLVFNTFIESLGIYSNREIKVYANSTNSQLTIHIEESETSSYHLHFIIKNWVSQEIFNDHVFGENREFELDLSTWNGSGIYTLEILDGEDNLLETKYIVLQ